MNRSTTFSLLLAALALPVSLGACDGSTSDTSASGENPLGGGSSSESSGTSGDNATTDADENDAQDQESESGASSYCDEFMSLINDPDAMNLDDLAGDPRLATDVVDAFAPVAAAAPDEVGGDWDAVVDALESVAEIDVSDPEAMSDPAIQEKLNGIGELETHFANISQHAEQACDMSFSATAQPDPS